MRIAYCEDEEAQIMIIQDLIQEYNQIHTTTLDIYHSAEEMLFENTNNFPYDFLILDIQMKQMNGIDLARKIRTYDQHIPIVFLSAVKEYVFEGYEVQALRYLLKPVTKEQLFPLLDQIYENKNKKQHYLLLNIDKELLKINTDDILYIESNGHYVQVVTLQQTYQTKRNFSELCEELNQELIQCHRSYAIQLKYVLKLSKKSCIMKNQVEIPISRNQSEAIAKAFLEQIKANI